MNDHSPDKLFSAQFPVGHGVFGRFYRNERGRLELLISIEEDTTIDAIRAAWRSIARHRDILIDVEGTDLSVRQYFIVNEIYQIYKSGVSYARIAQMINRKSLIYLCAMVLQVKELRDAGHQAQSLPFQDYLDRVRDLLRGARVKNEAIQEFLAVAFSAIDQGAFQEAANAAPVTAESVREMLRYWERSPQRQKLKEPIETVFDMLGETIFSDQSEEFVKDDLLRQAKDLLAHTHIPN